MNFLVDLAPGAGASAQKERENFAALWSAASAGYFGGQLAKFALPLFAAAMTESAALVSGVAVALTAPWLVIGLLAGALVDRIDRRTVLLAVNALRLLAMGAIALCSVTGAVTIPLLYLSALALGVADAFGETATISLAPMVVADERLEPANARLVGSQTVAEIVALPLGGALAAVALGLTTAASAACFALAMVALMALRGQFLPARHETRHILAEIGDGVRCLWSHRLLRTITGMAAVINACWSAWGALLVLYAVAPGPMGLSPFAYGLLLTAGGCGGLLGTFSAATIQRRAGRRWAVGINVCVNAAMFATTALTANPWFVAPAIVIGDFGGPIWGIAVLSLQARAVPDRLRGRVASAYRFVSFGAMAVGTAIGGVAAEVFGIRAVFAACALLTVALLIPFVTIVTESAMRGESVPA